MQRVDAIEAILLVQRLEGQSAEEVATAAKLHKLCIIYDDNGVKVPIGGGATASRPHGPPAGAVSMASRRRLPPEPTRSTRPLPSPSTCAPSSGVYPLR
jgi:hypothetical protein